MQINQLPAASSLTTTDSFAIDDFAGVTKKMTAEQLIEATRMISYGSPLVAATASAMTDTTKVYVYVGAETGFTPGDWYYHNGIAWVDGGVYNSIALDTDTTLTVAGAAADAKAVGDLIAALQNKPTFTQVSGDDYVVVF